MVVKLRGLVRRWPVASFFALAYVLSWSWWVPIAVAGGVVRGGDPWPTHMPGLLGPLLAAVTVTAVTGGRAAVAGYVGRLWRWRGGWRTALLTASPLAMLAVGLAAVALAGQPAPPWRDLFVISGLPSAALPMLLGLVVLNGLGEEGGWRGFAQEQLQARHGPVRAALLTAVGWAVWHAPLFVILATFRGFRPAVLPGFFLGMVAGAVVLAFVYNAAGGGVAAAACWHVAYNLSSASAAASGTVAAVSTTVVMLWAVVLLVMAWRGARRGAPSPLLAGRRRAGSEPQTLVS
ncbi:CPBP family intramembrane glutamic endopeptidase [Micromonospora carbonacea]|uniref:CPBP family intramembrane glutamic endopeptidase n=1 Tax=Micromonospora carbonacea TaxID=47853 RepID=UPI00332440B8